MKERRAGAKSVKRLLQYVAPWKFRYVSGLLVTALDPYVKSLLVGLFIGGMLEFAQDGDFAGVMREAAKWLLLMAAWLLAAAVGQYAFESAGRRAAAELKKDLYRDMICAPYRLISRQHSGDLLSRLDSDVESCQRLWGELTGDIAGTVLSVILGFITVWSIHWLIAVVLCGVGVFMLIFNSFMIRSNRKRYKEQAQQQGETVAHMSDLLAGSRLVRIYGEDTGLMKRFEDSCRNFFRTSMRALNVRACYYGFNQVNVGLTLAGSLGLGMILYYQGVLSLTALPLLIQMGTMVVSPIAELGWTWDSWNEVVPRIDRVTELLDQEKEDIGRGEGGDVSFGQGAAIRAEHMSFFYEEGKPALTDVNLEIPMGSTYGIVGHSGSGKSTLLRILMGMEDYQGSLRIGGREVRDMPLAGLRSRIAYVPQECPLFDGSIFENIQLGRLSASREEVLAAAEAADLARLLSAQLSLITENTDYGKLEKCYSIWICCDDIPKDERYSVSFYEIANTKNIGVSRTEKEKYDLLTLVIIKLGDMVYTGKEGSEGYELLRFLNAIMYPHQEDFIEVISEYIDFSGNEELWKEAEKVRGIGQRIAEEVWEEASEKGIQILVLDNLEEQVPEERILAKLQKRYNLTEEKAKEYYDRFAVEA